MFGASSAYWHTVYATLLSSESTVPQPTLVVVFQFMAV